MNEAQALAPVSFIKGGRMKKLKVYLAGPISKGDRGQNLAQFISWHEHLMSAGFAVFNPGLSMLLPWADKKSHTEWMAADIPFVLQSDLVVRLPGESVGADQEVEEAFKAGIPVYFAPEKPLDKPRSLSLERFTKEAKALVSDGYILADPTKPVGNGAMYRLLQNYGDCFSVTIAQAFGSGVRRGVAIAIKPVEVKPVSHRPEVAAGTATVEVKKPEPKFKKGDRVQVNGPSTHRFYTGPFPANGTVKQYYANGSRYDVTLDCPVSNGDTEFTFDESKLTLLAPEPVKPVTEFKPGDKVQIIGPSTHQYYTGPFPATGTVKKVWTGDGVCDVVLGFRSDYRSTAGFTFRNENLKPVESKPANDGPKFKKGDRVQVHGASIAKYYTGPFPATGTVGQVFPDTDCDVVVDGHGSYTFTEANLTLLPSYPAKVTAHGTDWHLATAADIGKPCYMMFPANNPPGALPKIEPSELGHVVKEVYVNGRVVSDCGSKAPAAYVPDQVPVKKPSFKVTDKAGHDRTIPIWVKPGHRALGPDDTIQKGDLVMAVGNGYLIGSWVPVSTVIGMKERDISPYLVCQRPMKDLKPQPAWVPGGYVEVKPGEALDHSQDYICNATDNERNPDGSYVRSTGWIEYHSTTYEPGDEEGILVARKVTKADTDASTGPAKSKPSAVDFGPFTPVVVGAPGSVFAVPQPGQDHPTKGKAPDPGPGFRLLHPDESVKMGDEFKDNHKWVSSVHWASNGVQSAFLWYRRPGSSTVTEAASQSVSPSADTPPQAAVDASFKKFASGAVRSSDADDTRFDLVSPIGLERLAMTCAEGAKKYGDHNWTKGMPVSECLNHCLRHVNMYLAGDKTEDHLAHAAWNLFAVMHFEKVKPDLVDVPARKESK